MSIDKKPIKVRNDFNLASGAAISARRDNAGHLGKQDGPKKPDQELVGRLSEAGRLQKGAALHKKAIKPKGPEPSP